MDFVLSPDWGKYGGLIGLIVGAVVTILAVLVLKVLPRTQKETGDRDERWLNKVLETFSSQAQLERNQCAQQHRDTLAVYHQANAACVIRDAEVMANQRELIEAQRATTHALHDLAKAVAVMSKVNAAVRQPEAREL